MDLEYVENKFDTIVVGAGHAGCEAALAAARLGANVLLCSLNLDHIGLMPCNPAIGGPAKSTLVREIAALGGEMGEAADATYVQMKMLNSSKGPAVRALRAQSDKKQYMQYMRNVIENTENIHLRQACITELIVENGVLKGVIDQYGIAFYAPTVILTTGTSLSGRCFVGLKWFPAGRMGEKPAIGLSDSLKKLGFTIKKLKTGTPPRVDKRTIDYSKMTINPGDSILNFYSFKPNRPIRPQVPCYLTKTNEETHKIIRANLDKSPMYKGLIQGVGPRYCPSIEDKVVRFASNPSHPISIEPEGLDTYEVYIQGFSSSLPAEVQVEMLRTLPGMEKAHIIKPAYAVEYDYIPAVQITHSLMTKKVKGLFNAGQINGTSGYEEAASQGIIAGINAARKLQGNDPIILDRSQAYIGVLIDDIVTKGTNEPYRMMTSRAEYRLLLRQDNADLRLLEIGHEVGLISEERYNQFLIKKDNIAKEVNRLKSTIIRPTEEVNLFLEKHNTSKLTTGAKLSDLLKRTELDYDSLKEID